MGTANSGVMEIMGQALHGQQPGWGQWERREGWVLPVGCAMPQALAAPASPEHCETSLRLFPTASSASPASYAIWQHLLRDQLISLATAQSLPCLGLHW